MQPRLPLDRALLIPIVIGVVSIIGITLGLGWIFLTSDLGRSLLPPTATPTATITLEARTPTPSPSAAPTQDETTPTATETPPNVETLPSTSTLTAESTQIPPTPSATLTPSHFQLLTAGKYDDTDPNIAYGLYWTPLKNPGTANAYKGTLHASTSTGNEATFRFTGTRVRLGYQRGKTFGTVTVLIDGESYSFHEQAFDLVWQSPELAPGDHLVQIIHHSGESINLDYIEVLD
jgi:cytoskeletal protein RodZ